MSISNLFITLGFIFIVFMPSFHLITHTYIYCDFQCHGVTNKTSVNTKLSFDCCYSDTYAVEVKLRTLFIILEST
jgi:hypothetical protein